MTGHSLWPDLPLSAWTDTCETLHRWTQIAGKMRLTTTPLVNHWWNVTFLVNSRGLVAPANIYAARHVRYRFRLRSITGFASQPATAAPRASRCAPMSVADFYAEFMDRLRRLDIDVHIWTMPSEIANAVPFDQDRSARAVRSRNMPRASARSLVQAARVMNEFRARFIGKASPVHFFWGSFDLAVTRFSGRTAPPPTGVTPNVASWVMAEAYSHEVSSCGFWPGNGGYGRAAFYVYAYPEPAGYGDTPLRTPGPSTTRTSASSSCRTTRCARRATPMRCCSVSCRKPTTPPPTWRNGIEALERNCIAETVRRAGY